MPVVNSFGPYPVPNGWGPFIEPHAAANDNGEPRAVPNNWGPYSTPEGYGPFPTPGGFGAVSGSRRLRACARSQWLRPDARPQRLPIMCPKARGIYWATSSLIVDRWKYFSSHWDGLIMFLEDPRIALDNNAAERVLGGPVLGRKIFYGIRSKRGAKTAAILYSLIETAKLCGRNPSEYLREAAVAAIRNPCTVTLPF